MRNSGRPSIVVVVTALTLGAAIGWAGEEPPGQKAKRDQALAALDKEVARIVPFVTKVETMRPCGAPATTRPVAGKGMRPRPALKLGGAPFCPDKYQPIKKKLQELIAVVNANSGSDDRAGSVISHWPTYTVSLEAHLVDLGNLKMNHKSAVFTGEQCKATSDGMLARAKQALANRSLDEFRAARTEADKDETLVREWVQLQESIQNSMVQWERNVRLFDPIEPHDKAWKPVTKAFHASAKVMLDQWLTDWAKASKTCADPLKGEDHPDHRHLERQLYVAMKKQLEDDLTKWRDTTAKTMYRHDCKAMQQLQKDICELDGDGEDVELQQQVEDQSDMMKTEMAIKVKAALDELDSIDVRAGQLEVAPNGRLDSKEDYDAWREALRPFKDEVNKEQDHINEVLAKGIARGARNPKIQLWINLGKQQHSIMEDMDTNKCALADQEYCAARDVDPPHACTKRKRPDCVTIQDGDCSITEFKPKGARAEARGQKQLEEYKAILDTHYNFALGLARKDELTYDPVGGMTFFHELEKRCAAGGKEVDFRTKLVTYDKCLEPYVCPAEGE